MTTSVVVKNHIDECKDFPVIFDKCGRQIPGSKLPVKKTKEKVGAKPKATGKQQSIFTAMQKLRKNNRQQSDVSKAKPQPAEMSQTSNKIRVAKERRNFRYYTEDDEQEDLEDFYRFVEGAFGFADDPMQEYPLPQQRKDEEMRREALLENLRTEVSESEQADMSRVTKRCSKAKHAQRRTRARMTTGVQAKTKCVTSRLTFELCESRPNACDVL